MYAYYLIFCFILIFLKTTSAQDGTLDLDFGVGGKAFITPPGLNQSLSKTVVQNNGKIVIAGRGTNCCGYDFSVARFNANGSPDTSFDNDGFVVIEIINGAYDIITTVAVQPDEKILAGGYSNNDFALVRYNVDGTLDTTFGGTGKVSTNLPGSSEIYSIVVLADSRILVGGASNPSAGTYDFTLARYNSNGTLDSTFDGDGIVMTSVGILTDIIYSLALQSDGKIVAAGVSNNGSSDDFAVVRFNPDGSLDHTFNGNGKLSVDFGKEEKAYSLAIQSDGKIILVGVSNFSSTFNTAIVRLLPTGYVDSTFGVNGKLNTEIGNFDQFYSVILQRDGKILAGGTTYTSSSSDYVVVRYNTDGSLDTSFDTDGKLSIDMGRDEAFATLAGWGDKIVIGGYSGNMLAVARLNNSSEISVLPIKLRNFTGSNLGEKVNLSWTTAEEANFAKFEIEKSEDGIRFATVGTIKASNGISNNFYSFQHIQLPDLTYYRLRMIDQNGMYTYSGTIAIKIDRRGLFSIVENPVQTQLALKIKTDQETSGWIVDAKGVVIKKWHTSTRQNSFVTINVLGISTGIYFIVLSNKLGLQHAKFVKN